MNKKIIDGMIIGKALYENKILLSEAINECC
jgi:phosphoribosylformimino-5-aminoimidazole carboxamide ribonucleotide (ProFAR) isomerase